VHGAGELDPAALDVLGGRDHVLVAKVEPERFFDLSPAKAASKAVLDAVPIEEAVAVERSALHNVRLRGASNLFAGEYLPHLVARSTAVAQRACSSMLAPGLPPQGQRLETQPPQA
jgi:hypothetical protein